MPALRNRQPLIKVPPTANGHSFEDGVVLKKKLSLFEDKLANSNDSNENHSINQSNGEDIFGDTQTIGVHPKFSNKSNDDKIPIFTDQGNEEQSSFSQSIKDQFAIALLRLQQDLDATNSKLNDIEAKVNSITRQNSDNRHQNRSKNRDRTGFFNKDNIYSLIYFGWPVVVFIAMRAIEKKSLSARLA